MASTVTLSKALAALTQATAVQSGTCAVMGNPTDSSSSLLPIDTIKAYCQSGTASAETVEAISASLAALGENVEAIALRTASVSADDLPVRYLGAAATYDAGAQLLKSLSLQSLNNQGFWYFSMNGVRVLCQLEIKAIGSRAVATIYGGVRAGTDGTLTQDGAYHILTTYYQDGTWAGWAEYFDATKVTALETRATSLETRAAAVEAKATANATAIDANAADIQTNANGISTLKASVETVTQTAAATQSAVDTHETRITALEGTSGTQGDSIDALNASLTSLSSRTATVENAAKANTANIAANTASVKTIDSRTQGVSATDLPVRYLGAAATYDAGAQLLKSLSLQSLNNQGFWYFSMNGVRVLCQLEIKAIGSRAVATIYGGVRAGTDGTLTQDGAYHILTTYYQDGTWTGWAEYFDATKLTALEARVDEMQLFYGVEWDTRVTDPTLTRIGSPTLHRTLPIQSQMRGCLLADDGTVNEYLPEGDWTAATRDGSRGQVMVEIPRHWRKCEADGTIRRVKLSTLPLPGYREVPLMYVSAYEAALDRTNKKLASVVNLTEQYRGGNGYKAYDADDFTLLGRPVNLTARPALRQYARSRNGGATSQWNTFTCQAWRTIYWLFAVEYATRNCQLPYNAQPTAEGYRQGGLGPGVTTIAWGNSTVPFDTQRAAGVGAYTGWTVMCWFNPFVPCGHTDSLGNGTGVVSYTLPKWYGVEGAAVEVPRYRGLENLFGHLLTILDGCNLAERADGTGLDAYVTDDPSLFNDTDTDGYALAGTLPLSPSAAYVKDILLGDDGHILCKETGGGSTSCFCDAYYSASLGSAIGALQVGYLASAGAAAGLAFQGVYAATYTNAQHGARLTFHP